MIDRYQTEEMRQLWSEKSKYDHWFKVEMAILRAWVREGTVPEHVPDTIESEVELDVDRIKEIEAKTKHDVAAFVDHVEEQVDAEVGRWFHYGVTSSDILDTATALRLRKAFSFISDDLISLLGILRDKAYEVEGIKTMGRTHGIHAEPMELGLLFARWYMEMNRNRKRLGQAFAQIGVGQASGPVGNNASVPLSVEINTLGVHGLGLSWEPVSTQIIPRDRYAHLIAMFGVLASSIENIATEIRHRSRTEVGEFAEGFSDGQKGSSVMPHKKNPILSENLCGLARMIRSNVTPSLENVALWHERDMSHSSVERFTLPNTTSLASFALRRLKKVISNLHIDEEALERNIKANRGRYKSREALHKLVDRGYHRDKAYRIVQEAAFKSKSEDRDFEDVMASYDADVAHYLSEEVDVDTMGEGQKIINRAFMYHR